MKMWAFMFLASSCVLFQSAEAASSHTVLILHHSFEPDSVFVQPGDTVRWLHQDGAAHTVTGNGTETWDSEYMAWGDVYLRVFVNPGSHDYVCLYHPMFGKVVVGGSIGIRPSDDTPAGEKLSRSNDPLHDVRGRKSGPNPSPFETLIRATPR